MTDYNPSKQDGLSKRLRGLRRTPVNLADFDARMVNCLPPRKPPQAIWKMLLSQLLTPARATAAGLLMLIAVVGIVVSLTGRPALASPQRLAEVYLSSVDDHGGATPIKSIADARRALDRKFPLAPQLSGEPAGMQPMSCCVHEIGRRQMACVTFVVDKQPVMLALASATDVRSEPGSELTFQGTTYVTGSSDGVNMVMIQSDGTWMCLMGRLSHKRLAELATSLRE